MKKLTPEGVSHSFFLPQQSRFLQLDLLQNIMFMACASFPLRSELDAMQEAVVKQSFPFPVKKAIILLLAFASDSLSASATYFSHRGLLINIPRRET